MAAGNMGIKIMKTVIPYATAFLVGAALLSGPALAQGEPQTIQLVKVDVSKVATGWRSTKIVGSDVVNNANDTIGKIDDLIISNDGKTLYAIISVGGFLGMGTHLVAVPYDSLTMTPKKIELAGATKEGLKALPEFKYANP